MFRVPLPQLQVVKLLVSDPRTELNRTIMDGGTPFFIACEKGHIEVRATLRQFCTRLLEQCSCPRPQHLGRGDQPLPVARWPQIVKLLARLDGVRLDDTIDNEMTPLHMACCNGRFDVVKFLASDPRVDVSMPQANGMTPFYSACYNGHLDVVRFLHRLPRVDATTCTNEGYSPFYVACENGHMEVHDSRVPPSAPVSTHTHTHT